MIVGVRRALDFTSTARAIAVCVLGWALALTFAVVLGLLFAPAVSYGLQSGIFRSSIYR